MSLSSDPLEREHRKIGQLRRILVAQRERFAARLREKKTASGDDKAARDRLEALAAELGRREQALAAREASLRAAPPPAPPSAVQKDVDYARAMATAFRKQLAEERLVSASRLKERMAKETAALRQELEQERAALAALKALAAEAPPAAPPAPSAPLDPLVGVKEVLAASEPAPAIAAERDRLLSLLKETDASRRESEAAAGRVESLTRDLETERAALARAREDALRERGVLLQDKEKLERGLREKEEELTRLRLAQAEAPDVLKKELDGRRQAWDLERETLRRRADDVLREKEWWRREAEQKQSDMAAFRARQLQESAPLRGQVEALTAEAAALREQLAAKGRELATAEGWRLQLETRGAEVEDLRRRWKEEVDVLQATLAAERQAVEVARQEVGDREVSFLAERAEWSRERDKLGSEVSFLQTQAGCLEIDLQNERAAAVNLRRQVEEESGGATALKAELEDSRQAFASQEAQWRERLEGLSQETARREEELKKEAVTARERALAEEASWRERLERMEKDVAARGGAAKALELEKVRLEQELAAARAKTDDTLRMLEERDKREQLVDSLWEKKARERSETLRRTRARAGRMLREFRRRWRDELKAGALLRKDLEVKDQILASKDMEESTQSDIYRKQAEEIIELQAALDQERRSALALREDLQKNDAAFQEKQESWRRAVQQRVQEITRLRELWVKERETRAEQPPPPAAPPPAAPAQVPVLVVDDGPSEEELQAKAQSLLGVLSRYVQSEP